MTFIPEHSMRVAVVAGLSLAWALGSCSGSGTSGTGHSSDLLNVNQSATNLSPSAWGATVQSYLSAHAP
ncbi:MAG: hypothetical protein WCG85_00135 [Polyangia bacterium]